MRRIAATEIIRNPIPYLFFIRTTPFLVQVLAFSQIFIQMWVFKSGLKGRDSVR